MTPGERVAYQLFVSHSFRNEELVNELQSSFKQPGIELYVAESDPQYGSPLAAKIEQAIDTCDALLVVMTKDASNSASVNQEVGYGKKSGKLIIALVEEGVNPGVFLQGIEQLRFSLDRLTDALNRVVDYVEGKAKKKDSDNAFWFVMGLAAIAIIGIVVFALAVRKK